MSDSREGKLRRAAMACGDDGVWDVSLGIIMLLFGAVLFLTWHTAWAASVLFVIPLSLVAKRMITVPRLREYETYGPMMESPRVAVSILCLSLILIATPLGLLIWYSQDERLPEWVGGFLPIILPVMLALLAVVILVTIGSMLGAPGRYFLYAAAVALAFLALLWDATPDWVTLAAPGLLMVIVGTGCTARFLMTHPMAPKPQRLRYNF